jgi:hypothetical protein
MIATLLGGMAIVLLTQTTSALVPLRATEVARWSTYEMALTATDEDAGANGPADLTGVFNGPDGQAFEIQGFWDGGSIYRIRFTPTVEGVWTFLTVSSDSGLDGHFGNITVINAKAGAHGFVRQAAAAGDRWQWQYDDDTEAGKELTALAMPHHLDFVAFRALDRLVTEAEAAGRIAGIVLFGTNDASSANMQETQIYQYLRYITARFGGFPNVVWCLHPAASTMGQERFWGRAGDLTSTLDPYFSSDAGRVRVLLDACALREASPRTAYGTWRIAAPILLAAQTFPNPVQTKAVEGIVRKSDAAAGALIVRAADGVEHVVHVTKGTVVHGKAADPFDGLTQGSHVIVHYVTEGQQKTAVEVDRVAEDGVQMMEARVTHIDRPKRTLTIKLADGSKQTLRLTERAAAAADDLGDATDLPKVLVYYTNDAGERMVHFFKRVR